MSYQNYSCIKFDHCYNTRSNTNSNIISTSCTSTFGQHRLILICTRSYLKIWKLV